MTTSSRVATVVFVLSLIAGACGDDSTVETQVTVATTAAPATSTTAGSGGDTTPAPTTTAPTTDTTATTAATETTAATSGGVIDITNAVLTDRAGDCAVYDSTLVASVNDLGRNMMFAGNVVITAGTESCELVSNNIPNHDFNDSSARFANDVAEVQQSFSIPRNPQLAGQPTALGQRLYNGVMLNGVPIDLLSAGCYRPDSAMADADGNVPIGCMENDPWLLDPLSTESGFGADAHNAHTQPNGSYHYHGSPNALFDDNPGPQGSPVIGFAADGFPIYGTYFLDPVSGEVREAISGYTLRPGNRPDGDGNPGGTYSGVYVDDWEFTDAGDLDECNGMTVDGQYGYYVTDSYPWIMACLSGTPDPSFSK